MTFAARIARVRMKNGGADVRVLNTPQPDTFDGKPDNLIGRIVSHAKEIAGQSETGSRLDGFVVIGLFSDGKTSAGVRLPDRLPRCLMPAYVSELLRRDLITHNEAETVFDDHFQWVDK